MENFWKGWGEEMIILIFIVRPSLLAMSKRF